jgi:hypothetical protein
MSERAFADEQQSPPKGSGLVGGLSDLRAQLKRLEESASRQISDLKVRVETGQRQVDELKTENANLKRLLKDNRKEIYADLSSIVSVTAYPKAQVGPPPHLHFNRAGADGYVAGLPNGHDDGKNLGSIRWMPKSIVEKAKKIAADE